MQRAEVPGLSSVGTAGAYNSLEDACGTTVLCDMSSTECHTVPSSVGYGALDQEAITRLRCGQRREAQVKIRGVRSDTVGQEVITGLRRGQCRESRLRGMRVLLLWRRPNKHGGARRRHIARIARWLISACRAHGAQIGDLVRAESPATTAATSAVVLDIPRTSPRRVRASLGRLGMLGEYDRRRDLAHV